MSNDAELRPPTLFQRILLPGLAFKAVVIGGGYATGREIAEFFLPAGPWGGIAAMALATTIWALLCIVTFAFAHHLRTRDYRSFFKALLGPGWVLFETAYAAFIVLILAVFGAASGAICAAVFGWPPLAGTILLMAGIALCVGFGNKGVERVFAWVSVLLYGVYVIFLVLALTSFGDRIGAAFATPAGINPGWATGGMTYAAYNVVGAVIILPVTRHLTSRRDAVIAGAIAGPLAMLPAFLFFICMVAFLPGIANETLPSDFLLAQMDQPWFRYLFQLMIFAALLESGTGCVHAINERIAGTWATRRGNGPGLAVRSIVALALLVFCMIVAERVGLVSLIANGYRALAYAVLILFIVPLLSIGLWRLTRPAAALEAV